jgi:hypothetical protein
MSKAFTKVALREWEPAGCVGDSLIQHRRRETADTVHEGATHQHPSDDNGERQRVAAGHTHNGQADDAACHAEERSGNGTDPIQARAHALRNVDSEVSRLGTRLWTKGRMLQRVGALQ